MSTPGRPRRHLHLISGSGSENSNAAADPYKHNRLLALEKSNLLTKAIAEDESKLSTRSIRAFGHLLVELDVLYVAVGFEPSRDNIHEHIQPESPVGSRAEVRDETLYHTGKLSAMLLQPMPPGPTDRIQAAYGIERQTNLVGVTLGVFCLLSNPMIRAEDTPLFFRPYASALPSRSI